MTLSITEQWTQFTLSLKLEDIPKEVVHQAKRHILDTLACAIGGYDSETTRYLLTGALRDLPGPEEATLVGTGGRTSALNAILINGAMVRYLDANDIALSGHDSEIIPGILAVSERQGSSGLEALVSTVAGYELAGCWTMGIRGDHGTRNEIEKLGWKGDMKAGTVMPPLFGRLMGMSQEQIANAMGIAGTRSFLLGIMDASGEQNTLAKNLRFPLTSHLALISTDMANWGITGPKRVFEGHMGFNESFMRGDLDLVKLTKFGNWYIMKAGLKAFSACYSTHGHLRATVDLVKEIDLNPENVEAVRIVTNARSKWHTGAETRRRVDNKETADHSSYYVNSIGIIKRELAPEHYTPELYNDPLVQDLMDRTTIEVDDEKYAPIYPGSLVEIKTKDGKVFSKETVHPLGHHKDPMPDKDIEVKFHQMARRYMDEDQRNQIIEIVWNLEKLGRVNDLMKLFKFARF